MFHEELIKASLLLLATLLPALPLRTVTSE